MLVKQSGTNLHALCRLYFERYEVIAEELPFDIPRHATCQVGF